MMTRQNIEQNDSTPVCSRNSIIDITFSDSNHIVLVSKANTLNKFPFLFTEKNKLSQAETRSIIVNHLKEGEEMPSHSFQGDWIIGIILLAAFLFSIINSNSKNLIPGVTRFFLFRGINDPASRDIGGIFHWQSTIINFISFLVISLFTYSAMEYYDLVPSNTNGMLLWLIILGIIMHGCYPASYC